MAVMNIKSAFVHF